MGYKYRTKPFSYQAKVFRETANRAAFGLFYDQGLGKSKIIIDTASYLYQEKKIRGLVVVAPNGVHRNWISDEIPAHMQDDVQKDVKYVVWDSSKAEQVGVKKQIKALMNHEDGLAIILVCYEACITPKCKLFLKKFLDSRPCLMVLDESHKIKGADSKVKTTLVALGGHARYRRIATGTPVEKVFDIYAQIRFLDPTFWKNRGFPTYEDFKNHFGIFVERSFGPRSFSQLVGHRNLEELGRHINEISERVTKQDSGLNLPPRLYTKRYYDMTAAQSRSYKELKTSFSTILPSGDLLKADTTLTRMLRLQQIVCGYVACEAEQPVQLVDPSGKNPRMDLACDEILEPLTHPAIVFSRFTADIDELMRRLGNEAVRYDGKVNDDDRAIAKKAFQSGDKKYFVMSNAGATGLTLTAADFMLNYANDFSLINRLQRDDRLHRISQTRNVTYCDIICPDTIDQYIVDTLVKKKDVLTQVVHDDLSQWI